MANEYTNDINIKNTISLRDILAELPSYVKVVFRGIDYFFYAGEFSICMNGAAI